jgi:hypothetical protein
MDCERWHQYKLDGQFELSHEGPWLHNNEKVCERVKLYDFKWSALREATRSFLFIYLNMVVYIVLLN